MKIDFSQWGPLTVLAVAVGIIIVIGGILLAALSHTTAQQYFAAMEDFGKWVISAVALGRGAHLGLAEYAKASNPSYHGDPTDEHGSGDLPN